MDAFGAERRWRLGRDGGILRRSEPSRAGRQHGFTDGVGDYGTAGGWRYAQRMRGARHGVFVAHAKQRRVVGRGFLYRNGLPARVLSDVPLVQAIFPADRAHDLFEGYGGEEHLAVSN